ADPFQSALGALETFECGKHRLRRAAGTDCETGGDQRILDLEFTDQRQPYRLSASAMFERKLLRKAVDLGCPQANAFAAAGAADSDRDDPQTSRLRGIDHGLRTIVIGRN